MMVNLWSTKNSHLLFVTLNVRTAPHRWRRWIPGSYGKIHGNYIEKYGKTTINEGFHRKTLGKP